MTDDQLRAISANWANYPVVGTMPDGAEIRNISTNPNGKNLNVREPSGYFCSPIAYSVRQSLGSVRIDPRWVV